MYPVSQRFKDAVRSSHKATLRAEVWRADQLLRTLEPSDGSVEIDGRRGVRRTCSLTIPVPDPVTVTAREAQTYAGLAAGYATYTLLAGASSTYGGLAQPVTKTEQVVDSGLVPGDSGFDDVTPFGNEVRLWRGVEVTISLPQNYASLGAAYATYTALGAAAPTYGSLAQASLSVTESEEVPLGVFVITDVDVQASRGATTLQIKGSDRALRVQRNRWTQPYSIASGANVATALQALLEDRYDDVVCSFTATTTTVPAVVLGAETDNDPWKDAQRIAESAGLDLYFDGDGIARLEPVTDYTDATPDAVYRENDEAMVIGLTRNISIAKTYNGVIATAEGSGTGDTFRGEAWDDDETSPTYRYGPFGQVPRFYSSPLITSQTGADSAAAAILAKSKGAVEAVEWDQIVDPSLEAGDVVAVTNSATKVDRVMVLDRVTIPLSARGAMRAVARTIRSLGGTGFAEEG